MLRFAALLTLAAALVSGCRGGSADPSPARPEGRRLLILSLDGLPWDLAQRRMAAGRMPHLAALAARGACAEDGSVSCFPAKTAPAHATLWTGAWADRHGILGNETHPLPRGTATILDARPGFDAGALRAEPIWRSAARAGLSVTVIQATQAQPEHPDDRGFDNLTIFNGYQGLVNSSLVTGGTFAVDGRVFLVERDGDALTVSSGALRVPLRRDGFTAVDHPGVSGVFYLAIGHLDASGWTLLRSSFGPVAAPSRGDAARFRAAVGGYAYNAQKLEPPLVDGTEWRRALYLAATRLNAEQVAKAVEWALGENRPDLVIAYLPQPDEALHLLLGRSEIWGDREATEVLDAVLDICDALVGRLVAAAGPEMGIAVVSDHGMAVTDRVMYPNLALERAGLLARDGKGRVDLSRTQVMFSRAGDALVVNTRDRLQGIVPSEEKEAWLALAERAVMREAEAALGAGALGAPVRPGAPGDGPRVSAEGDSWLSATITGGRMTAFLRPDLPPANTPVVRPIPPIGMHAGDPRDGRIRGMLLFAGPGFRHARVAGARHVDFAPTVSAWLGIAPPADSEGRILVEILED
ncbi:MAG: alkaline phosphatase family protein [Candidatus Brocadiae bacterium]|nr:alkaline phosphatase family protein [Candidatus Brocadiia bacterium]